MRGKLKVYGINTFLTGVQRRTIAAVTSQKQFADLIGCSLGFVREYGCETGNDEEIKIAFSDIGSIFIQCGECRQYHRLERKTA